MTNSIHKTPIQNTSPHNAPLWRRLCAITYDTFLLAGLIIFYAGLHTAIKVNLLNIDIEQSTTAAGDLVMFINVFIVIFLFFFLFWKKNGQTLGMQTWKIKIESKNGESISAKQTLIRIIIAPISFGLFGLGFLWCLFAQKECWQDIASKTRTIDFETIP